MKFQKYKTVARLNFSGWDDLNYKNQTAINKITFPNSVEDRGWVKNFKFRIDGVQDIKLSKHSRLILESCYISNLFGANKDANTRGPFQLRCKNLADSYCYDTTFSNNSNPILISGNFHNLTETVAKQSFSDVDGNMLGRAVLPTDPEGTTSFTKLDMTIATGHTLGTYEQEPNVFSFINPDPKTLYNFQVTQQFLNSPYFEFELMYIMYQANVGIDANESFTDFQLSLIIQDVDEEELLSKDTKEVDWKNWKPHFPERKAL